MDLKRIDAIKINFIVGHGRSGTTLLVCLFNEHQQCISSPEVKHLLFFYDRYKDISSVSEELLIELKAYLKLYRNNKRFLLRPEDGVPTLLDELKPGTPITYTQLSKLVYLCMWPDKTDPENIVCIIDKNPYYTFHIDKLFRIFPEAKMFAAIRDYRAYILSNRQSQKPFVKIRSVYYYAAVWNMYISRVNEAVAKYGDRICIVRYEDFVRSKEQTVEKMVNFVGLDYSPKLFDYHITMQKRLDSMKLTGLEYERTKNKLKSLSSPVNLSRVDAWQTQMTEADKAKAETICGENGEMLGYKRTLPPSRIAFVHRMMYFFVSFRTKAFEVLGTPQQNYKMDVKKFSKDKAWRWKLN